MFIQRKAISRTVVSAIILIIIVAAAAAAYYALTLPRGTSGTTSVQTSGGATGLLPTYVPSSKSIDTLAIVEWVWPIDDLTQLYALSELPWPNWLTYTVYQPLVSVNETAEYQQGTIQYLPGLATSWTVSSDGKTYTFNLRQNVQFSNGDPFNAYQVWGQMYGFYYLSGNSSTWLESYNFFDMSTARFGPSTIALMQQSGLINPNSRLMSIMTDSTWPIYVTGPYQIVFNLRSPFVWFPGAFVVFDGLIFDVQWLLQNGGFGTP
ncbi:MAG: hypothetical protein E6K90_10090, partial [Thaumarchaeota archaeon]